MAAKYPHLSPYNFCGDNPVNFVDPEGKDWFQNIITGELYYNANYTIDDTGKGPMHGDKSWIYLTNNNGFRSNIKDSDLLPFSSNYSDGEALFSSKEAERVINVVGYLKAPLEANVETITDTYRMSEGHITPTRKEINEEILDIISTVYIPKENYKYKHPLSKKRISVKNIPYFFTQLDREISIDRIVFSYTESEKKEDPSLFVELISTIAKGLSGTM